MYAYLELPPVLEFDVLWTCEFADATDYLKDILLSYDEGPGYPITRKSTGYVYMSS
jgi:hypothetical protein